MKIDADLFVFPFRDEHWQTKTLIGGLLALVGMLFFPLLLPIYGYSLRILRHTIHEGQPTLPEWDDWGGLFLDGLRMWVVSFVYLLPVWVLMCAALACWMLPLLTIPFAGSNGEEALLGLTIGGQIAGFALFALAMLPALFLGYFAVVAVTRLAALDALNAAFDFRTVWRLGVGGFKHFILALLVYYALALAASYVSSFLIFTLVLACLYPFALAAWVFFAQVFFGALFGLAYRAAQPAEAVAPAV